jgi:hypothetical protein
MARPDAAFSRSSPVFLGGATEGLRAMVRAALAAHPHFFTSHLPADDVEVLLAWARTMAEAPSARRPLWLSEAAFHCREALRQVLPLARFIHLGGPAREEDEGCLCLDLGTLEASPAEALARVFAFLGEQPAAAPALRRCA